MSFTPLDEVAAGRDRLRIGDRAVDIHRLDAVPGVERLPYTLRILLENALRTGSRADVDAVAGWVPAGQSGHELGFRPGRVLLHDTTGVPALVDLCALRDDLAEAGGDPRAVNPLIPAVLVVDHSLQVDASGHAGAMARNVALEYERNRERYQLLRWAESAFDNFKVVPPNTGIVHQVNLEHLATVVEVRGGVAFPDTLVGGDSHTTMVNGLGVLGWGVGGVETIAAMLGEPLPLLVPQVVEVRLSGALTEGATATDLVLRITELLRSVGVVGSFVEYGGAGLSSLTLSDRATIANMCPEYGSTCAFFPVDAVTLDYLRLTGRDADHVALVEAYSKENLLWHDPSAPPVYSRTVELDLASVEPSIAGPRRPQDRVPLGEAKRGFAEAFGVEPSSAPPELRDGAVVIAAITSCTNTSNPSVMVAAGLLAKNAVERGLRSRPWVKTSLAPGSQVVSDYYRRSGLDEYLDRLGFNLVGYGCTTCIGSSGPLADDVSAAVDADDLVVCAVLSGNRNFEARIHQEVKANYLASPPLVVAYALAGRIDIDLLTEPLGQDDGGQDVYLRDVWPSSAEIERTIAGSIDSDLYRHAYADLYDGDPDWRALEAPAGDRFPWQQESLYVRRPPRTGTVEAGGNIVGARCLAVLGDSVTTDHISPAGAIRPSSPAGVYLTDHGVEPRAFNTYATRRGNHELMTRATFANIRLRNELVEREGPWTLHLPTGEELPLIDAAARYRAEGVPLIVLAGAGYGTGSSRDWAAKGPRLLGVRAILAQSFERIHRSNLLMLGILPLEFRPGEGRAALGLTGRELYSIGDVGDRGEVIVSVGAKTFLARVRLETAREREYYRAGGVLPFVLRRLLSQTT